MRPIMALVVISGAIWITVNSEKICIIREPAPVTQAQVTPPPTPPQVTPSPTPPQGTKALETSSSTQIQVIRDNPVCSKYFEMAALVLGGLIGLAQPGISKKD